MRKQFLVTIVTDNDLEDKYPNFRWNYDSAESFIDARAAEISKIAGDGSFGYDIFVEKIAEKESSYSLSARTIDLAETEDRRGTRDVISADERLSGLYADYAPWAHPDYVRPE